MKFIKLLEFAQEILVAIKTSLLTMILFSVEKFGFHNWKAFIFWIRKSFGEILNFHLKCKLQSLRKMTVNHFKQRCYHSRLFFFLFYHTSFFVLFFKFNTVKYFFNVSIYIFIAKGNQQLKRFLFVFFGRAFSFYFTMQSKIIWSELFLKKEMKWHACNHQNRHRWMRQRKREIKLLQL